MLKRNKDIHVMGNRTRFTYGNNVRKNNFTFYISLLTFIINYTHSYSPFLNKNHSCSTHSNSRLIATKLYLLLSQHFVTINYTRSNINTLKLYYIPIFAPI